MTGESTAPIQRKPTSDITTKASDRKKAESEGVVYTDNPRRESTRELTEDHDIVELRELEPIENDTKPHHTRRTRSDWRNFCELALPPRDLCAMCVETLQGAAHDAPSARRFVKIVAALIAEIPQRAPIADAADVVWRLFLVPMDKSLLLTSSEVSAEEVILDQIRGFSIPQDAEYDSFNLSLGHGDAAKQKGTDSSSTRERRGNQICGMPNNF
ncbi:hypothetical protein B0J13DRAFT_529963 [Dactylonectria estremocensis]|uniref:Uncharacterized protein n=1 Tax=Dactylonectria estremocensis TaxID=1079267 RepID=A0A9P9ISY8_9HYPO|nr:hypothetical protein B0J13DRAFT_529963 [Dactylonectria estremocensis]